jgi:hypothetical protein
VFLYKSYCSLKSGIPFANGFIPFNCIKTAGIIVALIDKVNSEIETHQGAPVAPYIASIQLYPISSTGVYHSMNFGTLVSLSPSKGINPVALLTPLHNIFLIIPQQMKEKAMVKIKFYIIIMAAPLIF